jgi:hypothetical protein
VRSITLDRAKNVDLYKQYWFLAFIKMVDHNELNEHHNGGEKCKHCIVPMSRWQMLPNQGQFEVILTNVM